MNFLRVVANCCGKNIVEKVSDCVKLERLNVSLVQVVKKRWDKYLTGVVYDNHGSDVVSRWNRAASHVALLGYRVLGTSPSAWMGLGGSAGFSQGTY